MFSLLPNSIPQSQDLFCSLTPPKSKGSESAQHLEEDTAREDDPHWPKGMFHTIWHHISLQSWAKGKEGGETQSDGVWHPESPLHVIQPCFPRGGWTPACPGEVVNVLLCLHVQLLLYLLNCLYPNPWLLLFEFSHPLHRGRMCKGQCGTYLPAGVKP